VTRAVSERMARAFRILCAVDVSDCSRHTLARAAVLRRERGAELTVLHVLPPVLSPIPAPDVNVHPPLVYTDEDVAQVRRALAAFVAEAGVGGIAQRVLRKGTVPCSR